MLTAAARLASSTGISRIDREASTVRAVSRLILSEDRIHPAIRDRVAQLNRKYVDEVEAAIAKNDVVVVGMAQNPNVRRARSVLREAGVHFEYIEHGSYLGAWRLRLAFKLWTGWPTFPMVFVKGVLVGGADDVTALIRSGELATLLGRDRASPP
jgi:monothiol glutaredoxin